MTPYDFFSESFLSIEDLKFLRRHSIGHTGIGTDLEYIVKSEHKSEEISEEESDATDTEPNVQ